ncbi:putative MFS-type transporter YusP [Paenibacillus larvae subsp. larvae DSM 25430]|uniref:Putative MFS-type transporter YusP n=2 Tax=Paenibacillus larvae TaxID=1464 RepID=V9WD01_9BACL|nr:putative MFS-type transporter YusP [Paenibacillus larvae subsp. larvae DSM 25430]
MHTFMEHLDKKRKVTIMIAIMAALLFASINQTIVSTALPKIIATLGGMEYYSWVFTIYMLTSSITTILVGRLSDLYGRKPFILIGIGVFVTGAFLSGISSTIFHLITYRAIQGIGAGMIMSTSFTAVGDLFSPRERGHWQGLLSAVFGLSSVFGPTLGGYIVDHADWHWVFWVFLPFGIIAFLMILFLFPSVPHRKGESVDYYGSLFLTLFMVPLLLAFSWAGTTYAWGSAQIISLFAGAAVSLLIFILIERKARGPVLPVHLFKNSVFTLSNLAAFTMGAGMFGAIMYMPTFIQGVMGTSATYSGYITMPMTLSLVAGSTLSGQLISKTGKYKIQAILGLAVMACGMFAMSTMGTHTTTLTAILYMILVGFGLGIGMPVFTLTVQNVVQPSELGVATAASQLFRNIGGTIGVSVMGTVMAHKTSEKLVETMAGIKDKLSQLDPVTAKKLEVFENTQALLDADKIKHISKSLPADVHILFDQLIAAVREAMSYALSGVFFTGAAIVTIAVVLTIFLKELPLRGSAPSSKKKHGEDA